MLGVSLVLFWPVAGGRWPVAGLDADRLSVARKTGYCGGPGKPPSYFDEPGTVMLGDRHTVTNTVSGGKFADACHNDMDWLGRRAIGTDR